MKKVIGIGALLILSLSSLAKAYEFHYSEREFVEVLGAESCINDAYFYLTEDDRTELISTRLKAQNISFDNDKFKQDQKHIREKPREVMMAMSEVAMKKRYECIDKIRSSEEKPDYTPHYSENEFILIAAHLMCGSQKMDANDHLAFNRYLKSRLSEQDINYDTDRYKQDEKYRRVYTDFYMTKKAEVMKKIRACMSQP